MSSFKVVEIIDAVTIRVEPQWTHVFPGTREPIVDDKVKMAGFDVHPGHKFIKRGLTKFLLGRFVDLVNPTKIDQVSSQAIIECKVKIDDTALTMYFPELKDKIIAGKIYTD